MNILVRWDSALPVRLASKSSPEGLADNYLVFMSGLPRMGDRNRAPEGAPDASGFTDRLKSATSLQRKGKDPIYPDRVEPKPDENGILFYFPRNAGKIAVADKEVTFASALGPLRIKAKFNLKDMMYQGRLEL